MISLMSDMNLRATNEQTRKKAHRHRQEFGCYQREEGWWDIKG